MRISSNYRTFASKTLLAMVSALCAAGCGSAATSAVEPTAAQPAHGATPSVGPGKSPSTPNSGAAALKATNLGTVPTHAARLRSGVAFLALDGTSESGGPLGSDRIEVTYRARSATGRQVAGTAEGKTENWLVGALMPGLRAGIRHMPVGGSWRFWIPQDLAYLGSADLPEGTLVIDLKLLRTLPRAAPTTPEDVAAPPPSAEREQSGLVSRVLVAGTGPEHPGPNTRVTVHYSGWTTDGKLFDSSVKRGKPITLGLHQVIAGWTEGLQLMVEGEIRRLWIPSQLAYGGRPGKPAGTLVFDVELMRID